MCDCGRDHAEIKDARIVGRAQELYEEEGEVEIQANAEVSRGEDCGAYVQAWVWVPFEDNRLLPEVQARR